jgi:protein-S-isoprenylcysteine O-methyltransferase Ste14
MTVDLQPQEDRPGVRIPPPLLFLIPVLAFVIVEHFVPTTFVLGPVRWIAGVLLVAGGLALNVVGFITQKRAGTDPIPFNPTTKIVSHGLYRFSRNPMYIGFAFWTLGLAVLLNSVWALCAVPIGLVLIDRLVVAREEMYLERKFGDEYLSYKRRVRRWI